MMMSAMRTKRGRRITKATSWYLDVPN